MSSSEDLALIRGEILSDRYFPQGVFVVGSRAVSDSGWEIFGNDYDVVIVDLLKPSTIRAYHAFAQASERLTKMLGKSVAIAPLILPNFNLNGNLFVRKLVDQHIMLWGSQRVVQQLRNAVGHSLGFEPMLFYLLEKAQPLLCIDEDTSHYNVHRWRDLLKCTISACEVNFLLENPREPLPSTWTEILLFAQKTVKQSFGELDNSIRDLLVILADRVERKYSSPELDTSAYKAALTLVCMTAERAFCKLARGTNWPQLTIETSFLGHVQFLLLAIMRRFGAKTPEIMRPMQARAVWTALFSSLYASANGIPVSMGNTKAAKTLIRGHWTVLSPLPPL
jgi:hypothetical protein